MRKSKLMNWVIKPATNNGYGQYSGTTIADFYEKKFVFQKVIKLEDYLPITSGATTRDMVFFQAMYASHYDGTPYPQTNYYPWFSPIIILALDKDGNFWSFDSFWNNTVNWTNYDTTTLPDVTSHAAINTFLTDKWLPY